MKRSQYIDLICMLLILLFGYASTSKLVEYDTFRLQLGQSPFISSFAPILTWAVPAVELLAVTLLIPARTRLSGLYISLFLMTLFSAYIYAMLHYSFYIPCSCGGILEKLDWKDHLYLNLGFLALILTGIYLDGAHSRASEPGHVSQKTASA